MPAPPPDPPPAAVTPAGVEDPTEEGQSVPEVRRAGRWRGRAARLVLFAVAGYMIGCGGLAVVQRRLIYHPGGTRVPPAAAAVRAAPGELSEVTATTDDGLTLGGWLVRATGGSEETGNRRLVLYFHGNAGDRSGRLDNAAAFAEAGYDTLLTDYRGYGGNPGSPTEEGLAADARAWWAAAKALGYEPGRVVVAGTSLGGGVAVPLAAELCDGGEEPAGLLVRSTFDSLTNAAAHHQPWVPVRWLLLDRFDSTAVAERVTCPVLQGHGTADRIVPAAMGERLHAAFPDASSDGTPKRWVALPGVTHNGLRAQAGENWDAAERGWLAGL